MSDEESVLKVALPPATDYLTYLTILEYNLDKDELPILHEVLQDEKLVTNIGWDLVHLLVPMLPESKQCLEDIAILGNPREVVIKVTEELEQLRTQEPNLDVIPEESEDEDHEDHDSKEGKEDQSNPEDPAVAIFEALLHMLCILHPRIKTKRPSRFLEASVHAILGAYSAIAASPVATRVVLMFARTLSGSKRPSLPPRSGEPVVPTVTAHEAAPDPEADEEGAVDGEDAIQMQWLHFLITSAIQMHLTQLDGRYHAPLAWTERFVANNHPEQLLSERREVIVSFEESEDLRSREVLIHQILNVAMTDLQLNWPAMLALIRLEKEEDQSDEEDAPPTVAADGLVCLMAAYLVRRTPASEESDEKLTFFDHDRLIRSILVAREATSTSHLPMVVWDGILRTAWTASAGFDFSAESHQDPQFESYVSLLAHPSETGPSQGNISLNASMLSTHILQMHPSSQIRLACIQSRLPLAAYSSTKNLGLKWLQDEYAYLARTDIESERAKRNVFAEVHTLEDLAPRLFYAEGVPPANVLYENHEFFVGVLNLLYLLCSSKKLCESLEVSRVVRDKAIATSFLKALEDAISGDRAESGADHHALLEFNISQARSMMAQLPPGDG